MSWTKKINKVVVVEEARIRTNQADVLRYFGTRKPMVVAMEVGTHSPWMSQSIKELGHKVFVANARKLRLITENDDKDDDVDAELLARLTLADPKLLSPLEHRDKEVRKDRVLLDSRDVLVRARSTLINHTRGKVKSFGERLPSCAAERFHKVEDNIPTDLYSALEPVMRSVELLNEKIRELDKEIEKIAQEKYPETSLLRQVPGVGPITALAFVLVIVDPNRFVRNRKVGKYIGLTPKKDQSGDKDPQLSITKAGDQYLRRLLVGAAQYILGPFGPDSRLKRHGMKIAERGGKKAKKRAVVAVARKLAVLLLALWKTGAPYAPLYEAKNNKRKRSLPKLSRGVEATASQTKGPLSPEGPAAGGTFTRVSLFPAAGSVAGLQAQSSRDKYI